jgi:hypothetical protein
VNGARGEGGLRWVAGWVARRVFSPAKYLRTCVTSLAGLRGVSSRVTRDGGDRSAGSDGALPELALTAESKSKSKSKIRQSFHCLIDCQRG